MKSDKKEANVAKTVFNDKVIAMNYIKYVIVFLILSVLLSSCSSGTPELAGLSPKAQAEIIKKYGGIYKVGKPYQIAGRWYYPKEDYSYSETGVASWYGEDFNGKATANGERYDMNTLTAAHRTLPLPCIVKVTNLQNGRSIVVRVNDRGPYVKDRIIDLSKRGATLLGYIGQGTTKVKVEIMAKESKALKMAMLGQYSPEAEERAEEAKPAHSLYESSEERVEISEKEAQKAQIYASSGGKSVALGEYDAQKDGAIYQAAYGSAANADGKIVSKSLQEVGQSAPTYVPQDNGIYGEAAKNPNKDTRAVKNNKYQYASGYYYIQAGSFTKYDLAHKLSVRLKEYGSSHIVEADVNGTRYYRVALGPYSREEEAKVALAKIKYYGIQGARIEKK